jgi:shikimate kinase
MGLRGSGKTTLGRALAPRVDLSFIDLDDVTPDVLNCDSVAHAWELHGQEAFRRAELVALSRVLMRDGQLVAMGGGTPTAPHADALINHEREQKRAATIYLYASALTLRSRLREMDADRPSITGADPLVEIDAVLAARDPLYRSLADRTIDTMAMDEAEALDVLGHVILDLIHSPR